MAKRVLVLRTCNADGTSLSIDANGFKWPKKGRVKAPDWDPKPECGHGLHGLLWGEGTTAVWCWDDDARWLVVSVDPKLIVQLPDEGNGPKVKFPRGTVVFCGNSKDATDYIIAHGAYGKAVVGAHVDAGARGTATAGEYGTATAGARGTATAGEYGTATAGEYGTATAGYGGILQVISWPMGRKRVVTGYVGEDGIEPDVAYKVVGEKLVKA